MVGSLCRSVAATVLKPVPFPTDVRAGVLAIYKYNVKKRTIGKLHSEVSGRVKCYTTSKLY